MPDKCPHCNLKIVKYPLWEGEPFKSKFIPKNLFKMDLMSALFLLSILVMSYGYFHDVKQCEGVIEDPCGFCEESNCCKVLEEEVTNPEPEPLWNSEAIFNLSEEVN